jgi:hypothetical protein
MNLDSEGLRLLTTTSRHSMTESPARFVFTNNQYQKGSKIITYYTCDVCNHDFDTLSLAEQHLHADDDFHMHKNMTVEQIRREESSELKRLEAELSEQIHTGIQRMHQHDWNVANEKRPVKDDKQRKEITDSVLIKNRKEKRVDLQTFASIPYLPLEPLK